MNQDPKYKIGDTISVNGVLGKITAVYKPFDKWLYKALKIRKDGSLGRNPVSHLPIKHEDIDND
jgi:hypothetical protein